MAGSQDPGDNPVAINVVPMVDVIFCLCVFFMCSFKFKEQEIRFESWLPKQKGAGPGAPVLIEEVRVALTWDDARSGVVRRLGSREFASDFDLVSAVKEQHAARVRGGRADDPVTVDADPRVPWESVMKVVELVKHGGIDRIEFAFGAGPARPARH